MGLVDGMVATVRHRGPGATTLIESDGVILRVPAAMARQVECRSI